ncbi:MAG: bifunctional 4-hydroxy-2-oxoglutarate aldolase/2-dehydro-3-deoxy-phosphogluconate aldolase [Cyclobacteriaceae bacterium]|nr:bifunctional 4-hydroxy-2-oxoglutarate aldolase/2-dehydro-3-deoxy-phosphogluconate aldolase [Cyclobacteriaceae bacterium]
MKTNQLLESIQKTGILPLYYHPDAGWVAEVIGMCHEAGIRAFEFTNRGENALRVFEDLQKLVGQFPGMRLGIGTIMDAAQSDLFIRAGADFIVSPIVDPEVAKSCQSHKTPWVPGCQTLTEIIMAQRLGAPLVKLFPGNVLGPGFVKAVLGPCPELALMPTGGVTTDEQNLRSWFEAGVTCVGLGSALFEKSIMDKKDTATLRERIRQVVSLTSTIRT